jgi:hypothetical protein
MQGKGNDRVFAQLFKRNIYNFAHDFFETDNSFEERSFKTV